MITRRITVSVVLTVLCVFSGCKTHTPGGGPLRICCFDHVKSGRKWIPHHYFDPQRHDYNTTCWSPLVYNPCTCCWEPEMAGGYMMEPLPSPMGERIDAPQPNRADPLGLPDPAPELSPLDADPLPRLEEPGFDLPNNDGFVPDGESSSYNTPHRSGEILPASFVSVTAAAADRAGILQRLPQSD